MRALIQRVTHASVTIDGTEVAAIGHGLLILLGVATDDGEADVDYLVRKSAGGTPSARYARQCRLSAGLPTHTCGSSHRAGAKS